ncbi:hypothetical protein POM88_011295 [Heracleum sosnowskyi]|uniref:Uncharacterized protein n=1 Tax=Heracleum sosnowskyi TaxID=360622 RepID=A0AAD8N0N5_9APIA|nr:hypothetical protein POM88_011295 [Heracleum sosnowskyi]
MAWVSLEWPLLKNVSLSSSWFTSNFSELHDGMAYGFKIDWSRILCFTCNSFDQKAFCQATGSHYSCYYNCDFYGTDTSLPTCWRKNLFGMDEFLARHRLIIGKITGLVLAARFSIGIPFLVALLIFRSKKRHLSVDVVTGSRVHEINEKTEKMKTEDT